MRLVLLVIAATVAGCASVPESAPRPPGAVASAPAQGVAEQLYADLQFGAAADSWLRQATTADPARRNRLLLRAAHAAALADAADLLEQALSAMAPATLTLNERALRNLYVVHALRLRGDVEAAADILAQLGPSYEPRYMAAYLLAQAMVLRDQRSGSAGVDALVAREAYIDAAEQAVNRHLLWSLVTDGGLFPRTQAPAAPAQADTPGWLALGAIARHLYGTETAIDQALTAWDRRYPYHAARDPFRDRARNLALVALQSAPSQLALLLPLSGPLAAPAAAIRDGFLTANYADDNRRMAITLYDSSTDALISAQQALADGADVIVGPLSKDAVARLAKQLDTTTPVLALNQLDASVTAPPTMAQLGLAPEDNARAAAEQALRDGHTRALGLISQDDWAARALSAFTLAFEQGGGRMLDMAEFTGSARDYPQAIQQLLRLDDSRERHRRLQALVGQPVEYETQRRLDADMLFLAASATEARQLRPQLRFYHAADLSVYASGRVYIGDADPEKNKDLNDTRFCEMPWLLDADGEWAGRRDVLQRYWPTGMNRFARLYALGHDAYQLAAQLRNDQWPVQLYGATGLLGLDQSGTYTRSLPCGQFQQGIAVTLAVAPQSP